MAAILRVDSVGIDIVCPLTDSHGNPVDLELATVMTIFMTPPTPTPDTPATPDTPPPPPPPTSAKNATKVGSGKEGKIVYRTQPGDVPVAGDWKIQARVQYTNPIRDWYTEIYPLVVAANLNTTEGPVGTFRQPGPRPAVRPFGPGQ